MIIFHFSKMWIELKTPKNERGRPSGSRAVKRKKKMEEKRSGPQLTFDELLGLPNGWVAKTHILVQTEDRLWIEIEHYCREHYGLNRSKKSTRCKWTLVSRYIQLWNSYYRQLLLINQTGNHKQHILYKLSQTIFQSPRRRDKEKNPCIVISLKYIEVAGYFATVTKSGNVNHHGGIKLNNGTGYFQSFRVELFLNGK